MFEFTFPVGYYDLHKTKIIDYQLNRWHSLGYVRLEDMVEAGQRIRGLDDWKGVMVNLAQTALADGRLMDGTFHYRAAEFFTHPTDPDKVDLYWRFNDLLYRELFVDEPFERHDVPYEGVTLAALRLPRQSQPHAGTVVIHGGFDSFIEELYSIATRFAASGYDVILFEGPGQGATLKRHHLPMTLEWERPAKAVLDYFNLEDVTWLGVSMGGWLCFRAAAFEPRIKRVIALSIAYDYMKIPPKPVADFARWLLKRPNLMRPSASLKMKLMPQENWGAVNMMYIFQDDDIVHASTAMTRFNHESQHPEKVTQDVLILSGAEDHFIPLKLHYLQIEALTNAQSVTGRVFTRAEQAQNHCQVGNIGLAVDTMLTWLAEKAGKTVEAIS